MKKPVYLLCALLGGTVFLSSIPNAVACVNSMVRTKQQHHRIAVEEAEPIQERIGSVKSSDPTVAAATDYLNESRNADVITSLYAEFGTDINSWALNAEHVSNNQREVVLLVALAVLRTEGAVERYHERVVSKPRRKVDNVRWAVRAMEGLNYVGYAADRHVAEAWGRDPYLKKAALDKLKTLKSQKRLLSKHQFELLTKLEKELADREVT